MAQKEYDWKRFWCSRTGSINLSDGGYLYDPDSEWGRVYNPDVVPFQSIATMPCLVLLGEPGMGKTRAMRTERKNMCGEFGDDHVRTVWVDLRSYGSEDRFIRDVFESPDFIVWKQGRHHLHLFLDSLDECLMRLSHLSPLLAAEMVKLPLDRLSLRIACRTAVWPHGLEQDLNELWGNKQVGVYELAPLRRKDIVEAARANGLIPEQFLAEIERLEAVPLSIKPVTLEFLLNSYAKNRKLPPSQTELYFEGCRLLCEETSQSHIDARMVGQLDASQRMGIAARIAALTIFSNRYGIWTALDLGDVPEEDLTLRQVCGTGKDALGGDAGLNEAAVKEVLDTGLFSSRGPNRMGWSHHTYAEFLAALFLVQHGVTSEQVVSLLVHRDDPEGRIVPQLRGTAAWLASLATDMLGTIMKMDPEVLLRSDIPMANANNRAALVDALLNEYDAENLLDRDWGARKQYRKLQHPGLADQLRPYIHDKRKGVVVRRVAIDITESCGLKALQNDLLDVALDHDQPVQIRVEAAYAVGCVGQEAVKAKLKALLTDATDDPEDELKGCILRSLWPNHLTAAELFEVITLPKRISFIGAYQMFLGYELPSRLKDEDLPTALRWVKRQGHRKELTHPFSELIDAIMLRAWDNLDHPAVLDAFTKAALSRLREHDAIVREKRGESFAILLKEQHDRRRRVLDTAVPLISGSDQEWTCLVFARTPLARAEDIPWMIERLEANESLELKLTWARLIERAFDPQQPGLFEAVYEACQRDEILRETFAWLLDPVQLKSLEAEKVRGDYRKMQEWKSREESRPLLEPPPADRIASLLDEIESGNVAAWWRLNREMTLKPDSTHYGSDHEADLTVLPGWIEADQKTKARIIAAANQYLLREHPHEEEWLWKNILFRPAYAGYRALRLLLKEDPGFVERLESSVWKTWASIILDFPTLSGDKEDREAQRELIRRAYEQAPEEIIRVLMILIDHENSSRGWISITREVEHCWDEKIAVALLDKLQDEKLKPESIETLLADLLDHGVEEAWRVGESLVRARQSDSEDVRKKSIFAACAVMTHAQDAGWAFVWSAIQADREWGRQVVERVAHREGRDAEKMASRLSPDQLADVYIWLEREYPHQYDPPREGGGFVGGDESVRWWRGHVLRHLEKVGSYEACKAIERIMAEMPDLDWLKWTLMEARVNARRQTWRPPSPSEFLQLARDRRLRLVNSGEHLLQLLIESMKRLETQLQGETPAAIDIWDEIRKGVYRPKDENRLCDYVKRHIERDLREQRIIVNREVQIRRGETPGYGERTDIHVDAVCHGSAPEDLDRVSVIIEVKGCWNPGLDRDMQDQLVGRYLKDNVCSHGLYLVGWYNCPQWDPEDRRLHQAPKCTLEEARKNFDAQADRISSDGKVQIGAYVLNVALR